MCVKCGRENQGHPLFSSYVYIVYISYHIISYIYGQDLFILLIEVQTLILKHTSMTYIMKGSLNGNL